MQKGSNSGEERFGAADLELNSSFDQAPGFTACLLLTPSIRGRGRRTRCRLEALGGIPQSERCDRYFLHNVVLAPTTLSRVEKNFYFTNLLWYASSFCQADAKL